MPRRGSALMTEYRRSYQPSQFRCAAATYFRNREFRLQQLQRFQNHSTDPFIWPDDDDDDSCADEVTAVECDDETAADRRRELFEPAHQYRHRQLKRLYERRGGRSSIQVQDDYDNEAVQQRNGEHCSESAGVSCESPRTDSRCSASTQDDDHSSVVHVVGPPQHNHCSSCMESKQTQTPQCWQAGSKPPFALYGHRYNEKETSAKRTYNVNASNEISASALRAKNLRQCDSRPTTSPPSLRCVDRRTPVLVRSDVAAPVSDSGSACWTSEYEREYRPYERSRYRAPPRVDHAARRLHDDLKPTTPRGAHHSYLLTC